MKKIFNLSSLIILIFASKSYSQQRDTVRHKESDHHRMIRFISQRLNVDSVKAGQIATIQDSYKVSMKQLMSTEGLTEDQRHRAVDSLMNRKNTILATLLTPEQQAKFIPSTERNKAPEKKRP